MPNYSFNETLSFFSRKLNLPRFEEDAKKATLVLDTVQVDLSTTKSYGGLQLSVTLGLILHPISEVRLKELMSNHFLGVNTGGCALCLDEAGVTVHLKMATSPFTNPQENWEWLHRLVSIGYEWVKILSLWDEFVPLLQLPSPEFQKGMRI